MIYVPKLLIAIHHQKGSFSERWIEFCKKKNLKYKNDKDFRPIPTVSSAQGEQH